MLASTSLVLLAGGVLLGSSLLAGQTDPIAPPTSAPPVVAAPVAIAVVPNPGPPTIAQALESGVLIVVSKASQRMQVFKDGTPWLASPVSTGRRGHGTPSGVFPIMEKQRFHRSNIYSNAPMPFMQRLTRGGIAIHAGHLPGYPASHGCIRLPFGVARTLFALTTPRQTTVVITSEPAPSDAEARSLALAIQQPQDRLVQVAVARAPAPVPNGPSLATKALPPQAAQPVVQATPGAGQTIQLVAASSPQEAEARWHGLVSLHSELGRYDKTVVPVMVASRRYFRLRASGPGAFATCSRLKNAGVDCFRVI